MFSNEQMDLLIKKVIARLGIEEDHKKNKCKNDDNNNSLNKSQILVALALIAGTLEVESILVDRDQEIQIVLTGSLKQKTQLEKIMDQIGTMPFDEVMKTLLGRY